MPTIADNVFFCLTLGQEDAKIQNDKSYFGYRGYAISDGEKGLIHYLSVIPASESNQGRSADVLESYLFESNESNQNDYKYVGRVIASFI